MLISFAYIVLSENLEALGYIGSEFFYTCFWFVFGATTTSGPGPPHSRGF